MAEPRGPEPGRDVPARVREGMAVFDDRGERIGRVDRVYLGAASEHELEAGGGPATAEDPGRFEHSLVGDLARVFAPDTPPEPLRARLLRHGFLRVEGAGLLAADRYVLPDQIAGMSEDAVRLRVGRDRLAAA